MAHAENKARQAWFAVWGFTSSFLVQRIKYRLYCIHVSWYATVMVLIYYKNNMHWFFSLYALLTGLYAILVEKNGFDIISFIILESWGNKYPKFDSTQVWGFFGGGVGFGGFFSFLSTNT